MRCIALLILMAAAGRAEEACPFLNTATAAGVLGAEVTAHVTGDTCVFAHGASELRIEVKTVTLPHKPNCAPTPTSLRAIGNEAVACETDGAEQIAGRVRDRAFFVRLTSNDISPGALREKARAVAEQVAGILF
jgi:hypothetical protein